MKPRFSPLQLAIVIVSFTIFTALSCKKETSQDGTETEQEVSASKTSGEADAQSEIVFNEVFDDVMGVNDVVGMFGTGVFGRLTACPNVTIVPLSAPNTFPVKVILDFGTGCTGNDGHFRKGKIITEYTNRLVIPGASAITHFDGFYYDSIKVEGVHRISNITNAQNTPIIRKFEVKVENGKLSVPSGNYVTWNSIKTITQFEGSATNFDPRDDAFKVEGSANGTAKRGALLVAWQSTITEPLIKRFNCRWIVKGKVRTVRLNMNVNSPWVAVLDFGAGNCDNQAVVTINGVSHQITLP